MPKEKPYPLRLENHQESFVKQVMKRTGFSKAMVLRLAIDQGLNKIDWAKFRETVPVHGQANSPEHPFVQAEAEKLIDGPEQAGPLDARRSPHVLGHSES